MSDDARAIVDSPFMWSVPAVGAFVGTSTIFIVYVLTKANGHLPPGVPTPPISFLGAKQPEHLAYQVREQGYVFAWSSGMRS